MEEKTGGFSCSRKAFIVKIVCLSFFAIFASCQHGGDISYESEGASGVPERRDTGSRAVANQRQAPSSSISSIFIKVYIDGSGSMNAQRGNLRRFIAYAFKEVSRNTSVPVKWGYYITKGGASPSFASSDPEEFYNKLNKLVLSGKSQISGMIKHTLQGISSLEDVAILLTDYKSTEQDFTERKYIIEGYINELLLEKGFPLKVVYAHSVTSELSVLVFGSQVAVDEAFPPIYLERFLQEATGDSDIKWVDFSSTAVRYFLAAVIEGNGIVLNDTTACDVEPGTYSGMTGVKLFVEAYSGAVSDIFRNLRSGRLPQGDWDSLRVERQEQKLMVSPKSRAKYYPNYILYLYRKGGAYGSRTFTLDLCQLGGFTSCKDFPLAHEDSFVEGLCRIFYEEKLIGGCPFQIKIRLDERCRYGS